MATKQPPVDTKRTYSLSTTVSPPISGYGGYDEWELFELPNTKADKFFQELQQLVEKYGGEFIGAN